MKINWQTAALNIRQSGKSLQSASKECGLHRGILAQIARGELIEPKFSQGIAILNCHLDTCGREKTAALRGAA